MDDYVEIMNLVSRFLMRVDERNWDAVREMLTDPFHADFSSLTGKPATSATPEAFTKQWRSLLSAYDATQHQIGNQIVEIDGLNAEFCSHVTTSHFRGNETEGNTVEYLVGSYRFSLVRGDHGWKLASVIFTLLFKTLSSG